MPMIVVTGPPCGGKSTHVETHAEPGDLVVDLDAIAAALGYGADHIDWSDRDHPAIAAARTARAAVLKALPPGAHATWVIDCDPHPTSLKIWRRSGVKVVDVVPALDEAVARAHRDGRPASTVTEIRSWYRRRGLT